MTRSTTKLRATLSRCEDHTHSLTETTMCTLEKRGSQLKSQPRVAPPSSPLPNTLDSFQPVSISIGPHPPTPSPLVASFKLVVVELISLLMPTIAALPGHAFATGFLLALSHSKIDSASARRDVMLRGAKIRGNEAVRLGIAESAHDSAESALEAYGALWGAIRIQEVG
ncbi:ClpP/crotonase-like domain containing protein [Trema orientale]|uniref:ClpP/crotonase-like domain containing protein n=1 Tax=Trema orientale TaxID=63057 RepID=A0A2P5F2L3_TREOI|nr:ClpP/crotonase-like domain containing protein [Trema orientale]